MRYYMITLKRSIYLLGMVCALAACQSQDELKLKHYYIEGQALYTTHCANCHQENGEGLAGLYPPIAKADFLANNKNYIICGIKHGINDTIQVNGKTYHQPMPANAQLQAIDIAEIVTYIYNEWGNEKKITPVKEVQKVLDKCE